jgi:hypothetical protein
MRFEAALRGESEKITLASVNAGLAHSVRNRFTRRLNLTGDQVCVRPSK